MTDPGWEQLLYGIAHAGDSAALHRYRKLVHDRMAARLPRQQTELFYDELNDAHDAFVRRAIQLAGQEMARLGNGIPPVPFAYLLFGSGGRREQTLLSDQDSGLIYADSHDAAEQERNRQYFSNLSARIVRLLLETGYPLCEGNVLSSNADWCCPVSGWKDKLNGWFAEPAWESVRYLLIVADSRCVYGDGSLHDQLQDCFYGDVLSQPIIVKRMLENTMKHKVLLNIFGQLLKEQYGEDAGSIDIKYGAYIPMVNAIRLLAIEANLRESSTLERIRSLERLGLVETEEAAEWIDTFRLFLRLRMLTTEKFDNGQFTTNGKLSPGKLTKELSEELKSGLKLGKKLQRKVYRQTMNRL